MSEISFEQAIIKKDYTISINEIERRAIRDLLLTQMRNDRELSSKLDNTPNDKRAKAGIALRMMAGRLLSPIAWDEALEDYEKEVEVLQAFAADAVNDMHKSTGRIHLWPVKE